MNSTATVQTSHTFIIADDHPLFRTALAQAVSTRFEHAAIHQADTVDGLQQLLSHNPSVSLVLLDLHMPGAQGFSSLIHICACYPSTPVVIVSADATAEVMTRALRHGAAGFIPKSCSLEEISTAVTDILNGGQWMPENFSAVDIDTNNEEAVADILATLTPQQFRVSNLIGQGLLNKQIAYEMSVTEATVKAHATEIYRKLGVNSRTQAVLTLQQLDVKS
ncbi:response regulator transcription factor [Simiduia curdlanivorans]|uniref:Response regulator n=1 Tax=Simiduia curdlanivorans TaxID=1492769 RepID=A0ABV8V289_9GAMM|nr:response regulator transcription factor [Simiduia curdlanivorans]MDN3640045.1 response regulator transcription factor [Simiduia curdlanivorans]